MINDIFESLSAYSRAVSLISKHRLWRFIIIPGLVSMVVMLLFIIGPVTWFANSDLEQRLLDAISYDWLRSIVEWGAEGLAVILMIAMIFFLGKYVVLIVSAPFMGALSEKIEEIETGIKPPNDSNFVVDLVRGIRVNLRNLVREILLTLFLLLFHLLPVIGSIAATVLTFLVEAYFAGFGNMDYTLERKRFKVRESVSFVRQHRGIAIGNGAVFLGLLLIPILGWFLAPAYATAAATLASLKRIQR